MSRDMCKHAYDLREGCPFCQPRQIGSVTYEREVSVTDDTISPMSYDELLARVKGLEEKTKELWEGRDKAEKRVEELEQYKRTHSDQSARVKELEGLTVEMRKALNNRFRAIMRHRRKLDSANARVKELELYKSTSVGIIVDVCRERDAANADRARLREHVRALIDIFSAYDTSEFGGQVEMNEAEAALAESEKLP